MREGPVGFRHLVGVLALLDCVSPVIGCVEQLSREPFGHRAFVALTRGCDNPAYAECLAARRAHFNRHLIGGAADATRPHLDRGHHVVEGLLEYGQRVLLGLAFDRLKSAVDDSFRYRLFAIVHNSIHEFADDDISELRVRDDVAFFGGVAARHDLLVLNSRSLSLSWPGSSRPSTFSLSLLLFIAGEPASVCLSSSPGLASLARGSPQKAELFRPLCSVFRTALLAVLH